MVQGEGFSLYHMCLYVVSRVVLLGEGVQVPV